MESPRQILKTAYEARMIQNDILWLEALRARNNVNVAHAYNNGVALDIIKETKNNYYNIFVELKETIDKNWL
ncbi:nucleotidyltransferase substrate binding protein [Eubacterium sp. MSJ-13]|uniref:nucleotidyltransferase substrate binding protein n=1 Tax=Eubacterium sp. MSJ-13 TaxID=2841513 RepID=UPI001C11C24B|nr:nucleotidyltransferase substrate binding protein [Eubacterium sp. MSJ-13]MBU5479001.1 nucleotidyltransferase substrate binding protein [Eubacterium sp. MSJ-13]